MAAQGPYPLVTRAIIKPVIPWSGPGRTAVSIPLPFQKHNFKEVTDLGSFVVPFHSWDRPIRAPRFQQSDFLWSPSRHEVPLVPRVSSSISLSFLTSRYTQKITVCVWHMHREMGLFSALKYWLGALTIQALKREENQYFTY